MENEKYERIDFSIGSSVKEAVSELLLFKEKGKLVSANFNGVTLYSDTVTLDSAYLAITGKTYEEFVSLYRQP